jgi:hypothetical protein
LAGELNSLKKPNDPNIDKLRQAAYDKLDALYFDVVKLEKFNPKDLASLRDSRARINKLKPLAVATAKVKVTGASASGSSTVRNSAASPKRRISGGNINSTKPQVITAQPAPYILAQIKAQRDRLHIDPSLEPPQLREEVGNRLAKLNHTPGHKDEDEIAQLVSLKKLLDKQKKLVNETNRLGNEIMKLTANVGNSGTLVSLEKIGNDFDKFAESQKKLYGSEVSETLETISAQVLTGLYNKLSLASNRPLAGRRVSDKLVGMWNKAMSKLDARFAKYDPKQTAVAQAQPSHKVAPHKVADARNPNHRGSKAVQPSKFSHTPGTLKRDDGLIDVT